MKNSIFIIGIGLLSLLIWKTKKAKQIKEEGPKFVDTPSSPGPPPLPGPPSSHDNYSEHAESANFTLAEFASKDGNPVPNKYKGNIQLLMNELEVIRSFFNNRPIVISSGYRTPAHNQAVGGVPDSMHIYGKAADIYIPNMPAHEVQEGILQLIQSGEIKAGGLGLYDTFTHYDIGRKRTWDYTTKA